MPALDDIKNFADEHDDKVDQGLEKAGEAAGAKFGHSDQIDKGVEWAQEHTGSGSTQDSTESQVSDQES